MKKEKRKNKFGVITLLFSVIITVSSPSSANPMLNSLSGSTEKKSVTQSEEVDVNILTMYNFKLEKEDTFNATNLSLERAREFLPPIEVSIATFEKLIEDGKKPHVALMISYDALSREINLKKEK